MATVIDALIVTLGLDAKGYTDGSKKAVKSLHDTGDEAARVAKEMEARGKQAAQFFAKLRTEALSLLAVFTAGVGAKSFTENVIKGAASLGMMSANLSMSTEDLSAWQRAAERAGGSAEDITAQLQESAAEVSKWKLGQASEGRQSFFAFGGDKNALKDGNSYLLARSKIVNDIYKVDPARAALVAGQIGISQAQFNLMKQGPAAVLALVAAQQKNSVVTKKQTEDAQKLSVLWLDVRDRFEASGKSIVLRLMPSFTKFSNKLLEIGNWVADHQDEISDWIDKAADAVWEFVETAIEEAIPAIKKIWVEFKKMVTWFVDHKGEIRQWIEDAIKAVKDFARQADSAAASVGGWKNVLLGLLGLKILGMAAPLISLASALAGVATSLGLIAGGTAGLAVLVGAVSAYAGYKAAEYVFGDDPKKPGEGLDNWSSVKLKTRSQLRDEASKQRTDVGLSQLLPGAMMTPDEIRAEARQQWMAAFGLPQLPSRNSAMFSRLEKQYGLPTNTLDSIWAQESARGKHMLSPKGAKGHFGFMDGTARDYGLKDPNNLLESADAAARMMRDLLKKYGGDKDKAFGAYNWGQGNVDRKGLGSAPLETRNYIASMGRTVGRAPSGGTTRIEVNNNGPVTVQTQSTDAKGIVREFNAQMGKSSLASQADSGLQ